MSDNSRERDTSRDLKLPINYPFRMWEAKRDCLFIRSNYDARPIQSLSALSVVQSVYDANPEPWSDGKWFWRDHSYGDENEIVVWNVWESTHERFPFPRTINDVCVLDDARLVVQSLSYEGRTDVWNPSSNMIIHLCHFANPESTLRLRDGTVLLISLTHKFERWDVDACKKLQSWDYEQELYDVYLSSHMIQVFEMNTRDIVLIYNHHIVIWRARQFIQKFTVSNQIRHVCLVDANRLVTADDKHQIHLFNVITLEEELLHVGFSERIYAIHVLWDKRLCIFVPEFCYVYDLGSRSIEFVYNCEHVVNVTQDPSDIHWVRDKLEPYLCDQIPLLDLRKIVYAYV